MRGNGEILGPKNLPTTSIAGGIWNMINQQRAIGRGQWPGVVVADTYFPYVSALLEPTSTNAQQNNTFLDSSSNAFPITRNGTPTQGTVSPYYPTGYWSGYFAGTTASQNSVNPTITALGTGNFTVEFFYFWNAETSSDQQIIDLGASGFSIYSLTSTANVGVFNRLTGAEIFSNYAITKNNWVHIAFVRAGTGAGQTTLYINGSSVATSTVASDFTSTAVNIGSRYAAFSSNWFPVSGYVSNVRISNIARTITVPTTPYTSDANTLFLGMQANRFINSSGTALTVNGTPQITHSQPFAPPASYSAAAYGGSGIFATGNYLTNSTANVVDFGTADFTVEFWAYYTAYPASTTPALAVGTAATGNGIAFGIYSDGRLYATTSINPYGSTGTVVQLNTWNHIAFVRTSGVVKYYLNGVLDYTVTISTNFNEVGFGVGAYRTTGTLGTTGYLSNIRVVKGTPVYTAAFTPPTAPVTAITNTSLLVNATNAGIYDAAGKNNMLTVADAQVSTTVAKWGTTSLKFDGTTDALSIPTSINFGLGTGDWTIEFWVYLNVAPSTSVTLLSMLTNVSGAGFAPHIYCVTGGGLRYYTNSSDRITGGVLTAGVWNYVAVVKSSNNTRLYINGTQSGSTYPDTNNYGTTNPLAVADYAVPLSGGSVNGYFQDVRITKGIARTITTPTAAFPTR